MSVQKKEGTAGGLGSLRAFVLFSFNTEHLVKKDKVRFFYALKGRNDQPGIVQRTKAEHLGRGVLLVSADHAKEVEEFLKFWKCNYTQKEVWLK